MNQASKSYLALSKSEGGPTGFAIVKTREEALAFGLPITTETDVDSDDAHVLAEPSASPDETPDQTAIALVLKYVNLVFSFYPLIQIGTTMKSPLIEGFIRQQIQSVAEAHCPLLDDLDHVKVFELNTASLALLDKDFSRFWSLERGLSALPNATLLSIVASFDTMFSEIAYTFLKLYSSRYNNDQTTISVARLLEIGSVDKVISEIISNEIFDLMRGSHYEQTEFIKEKLNVDIQSQWSRYPDFIEIFERRNLIAHGEAHFTLRYNSKSTEHGNPRLLGAAGEKVSVSSSYLRHASDILLEYGVLLIFSLWRKHIKIAEGAAFEWTNIAAMKTMVEGRHTAASRILFHLVTIKSKAFTDQNRKMATVNLANALYKSDKKPEAEKVLNQEDWTAVSPDFKICIAAIRGDLDGVVGLMDVAVKSGSVSANDFREWPAFDKVRKEDKFSVEYQRIFSEPLVPAKLALNASIDLVSSSVEGADDGGNS